MNKMYKPLIPAIIGMLTLSACNSNNQASDSNKTQDSLTKPAVQTTPAATDDADLLPNLLQIGSIFKNADLTYSAEFSTPISDLGKLNTQFDRSVTLGIYTADLSYCTVNKKKDKTSEYLKAVKGLADNIGLGSIYGSDAFSKRYEANMSNDDSLAAIVVDLQMKTDDVLAKNKQNAIRVVIYAGAWIESMNIAAKVYIKNKTATASGHITEQITILNNILKVLEKYQVADPKTGALYKDLKDIDNDYANFDEVKNYDPSKSQSIVLTDDHIAQFGGMVDKLHNKLTGNQ